MAVILIVEDDVFTREVTELLIGDLGHQTILADDIETALALLRSSQPIGALFTDIYLKSAVYGGCELARMAVELRPELRVLYTTGNFVTDGMRAQFVEGAHFLGKPYTEQQLHDSVDGLLAA